MPFPSISEYQDAIQNPKFCFMDPELTTGTPVLNNLGLPKPISGGFASVYQMVCNPRKYAVRCFNRYHTDQEQRYAKISAYLQQKRLPYMVSFEFINRGIRVRGQWYPILKMEWIDGETLNSYIERNLNNPTAIQNIAEKFLELVYNLKSCSIAHGDLQHGNILVVNDELKLIDYDGMYVPGLDNMSSHEIGNRNYQHPCRCELDFGPHLDNFSAWVIYISLLGLRIEPALWYRVGAGDEYLLLSREDFDKPQSSVALKALMRIDDTKKYASQLQKWLIPQISLAQVMPLDEAAGYKPVATEWWKPYATTSATKKVDTGPSWLKDHIQPMKPVIMKHSCIKERFLALTDVLLLLWLIIDVIIGPDLLYFLAPVEVILIIFTISLFRKNYRAIPEVRKKTEIQNNLYPLMRETKKTEQDVQDLRQEEAKVNNEGNHLIADLNSKIQDSVKDEKAQITKFDSGLQALLTNNNAKRLSLKQSESKELSDALAVINKQYFDSKLSYYTISSANISGIGPEMKSRLIANGIRTAADVSSRVWGIPGFGPVRVGDLLSWRQRMESLVAANAPKSLPPAQENAIKARYQTQLQLIDKQDADAKSQAQKNRNDAQANHRQEQDRLSAQIRNIQSQYSAKAQEMKQKIDEKNKELSDKKWQYDSKQQEFKAYSQVTFRKYLKNIFSFKRA